MRNVGRVGKVAETFAVLCSFGPSQEREQADRQGQNFHKRSGAKPVSGLRIRRMGKGKQKDLMKGIEGRHGHNLTPMEGGQQPDDITVTIRLGTLDQRMDEEDGGVEIVHSAGPGFKASLPELWVSGYALGSQNAFQALAAHLMERRLKRLVAEKFAESLRAHISHVQHSSRTHGRWQKRYRRSRNSV